MASLLQRLAELETMATKRGEEVPDYEGLTPDEAVLLMADLAGFVFPDYALVDFDSPLAELATREAPPG